MSNFTFASFSRALLAMSVSASVMAAPAPTPSPSQSAPTGGAMAAPMPGASVPVPVPQQPGGAPVASVPLAVSPAGAASAAASPARSYSYYGERYRDPFVPLLGDVRADLAMDRPPQIASLSLKGIVQDANGRMALLTSGVSSYILRAGKLFDGRNRPVKKISGVIKADSVVLIGADRTVRELRTKVNL